MTKNQWLRHWIQKAVFWGFRMCWGCFIALVGLFCCVLCCWGSRKCGYVYLVVSYESYLVGVSSDNLLYLASSAKIDLLSSRFCVLKDWWWVGGATSPSPALSCVFCLATSSEKNNSVVVVWGLDCRGFRPPPSLRFDVYSTSFSIPLVTKLLPT